MNRRAFVAGAASSLALAQSNASSNQSSSTSSSPGVRLGIDLFSIRSQGWTPFEYLDYAARQGAKVVHFSEIRFIGSLETANLKKVRAHAEQLGIQVEIGMRSICPSSQMFDPKQGSAEEQLTRMIVAAQTVGSPIVRAVLGSMEDRKPPGIESRIEDTAKVLRAVRSRATDAGIKIAIENHAGDMQARELKSLIEAAGREVAGVCLDSGNPLWTIEDPHLTLETLHPYVLTSHVRDTAVWPAPDGGAAVQWVRMGDGNVGIDDYVRRYAELCPGRALSLEIIVTQPRIFAYNDPKFWGSYQHTPAWEFARFVRLVESGKPREKQPPLPKERAAERELQDLEASVEYTKKLIHL